MFRSLLAVLSTFFIGIGCPGSSGGLSTAPVNGEPTKDCKTLLLYYAGADSNLEKFLVENMEDIAKQGSVNGVCAIAQMDRTAGKTSSRNYSSSGFLGLSNFTGVKRFRIDRGSAQELGDIGESSTGDASNLADFIGWAGKEFPADRIVLVMMGHGNTYISSAPDETESDRLTGAKLAEGIRGGLEALGRASLDMVIFDMCLMASAEVLTELAFFVDFVVASQTLLPGKGVAHDAYVSALARNIDMSTRELGQIVVDTFEGKYAGKTDAASAQRSLGFYDLSKVPEMVVAYANSITTLQALAGEPSNVPKLVSIFDGAFPSRNGLRLKTPPTKYDFLGLSQALNGAFPGRPEFQALEKAVRDVVVERKAGPAAAESGGYMISFPKPVSDGLKLPEVFTELALSDDTRAPSFIEAFENALRGDDKDPDFEFVKAERKTVNSRAGLRLSAKLAEPGSKGVEGRGDKPENISHVDVFLAKVRKNDQGQDEIHVLAIVEDEVGKDESDAATYGLVEREWDFDVFALQVGDKQVFTPFLAAKRDIDSLNNVVCANLGVLARYNELGAVAGAASEEREMLFRRCLALPDAIAPAAEKLVDPNLYPAGRDEPIGELNFTPGDSLNPISLRVKMVAEGEDATESEKEAFEWCIDESTELTLTESAPKPELVRCRIPGGEYLAGVRLQDASGNFRIGIAKFTAPSVDLDEGETLDVPVCNVAEAAAQCVAAP